MKLPYWIIATKFIFWGLSKILFEKNLFKAVQKSLSQRISWGHFNFNGLWFSDLCWTHVSWQDKEEQLVEVLLEVCKGSQLNSPSGPRRLDYDEAMEGSPEQQPLVRWRENDLQAFSPWKPYQMIILPSCTCICTSHQYMIESCN